MMAVPRSPWITWGGCPDGRVWLGDPLTRSREVEVSRLRELELYVLLELRTEEPE